MVMLGDDESDQEARWDHQQHYDMGMKHLASGGWQVALCHMVAALYRLEFERLGFERSRR